MKLDKTWNLYLLLRPKHIKDKYSRNHWHFNMLKIISEDFPEDSLIISHGAHFKVWTKTVLKPFKNLIILLIKDKTYHVDPKYLEFSSFAYKYEAKKHNPNYNRLRDVNSHYMANLGAKGYKDELKYHKERVKTFTRLIKSGYSNYDDHGWEIDIIKKHKITVPGIYDLRGKE